MQYKLAALYLLNLLEHPLTISQICDVLMEKLLTNFFTLMNALTELHDDDLILTETVETNTYYRITEEGKNTLQYLTAELSPEMKHLIHDRVKELHLSTRQTLLPHARYDASTLSGPMVRCTVMNGSATILDLRLSVPGQEAAEEICRSWPLRWEKVYTKLMEELL